jgi:hypothetical protein
VRYGDPDAGRWRAFAAGILLLAGAVNGIGGVAAVSGSAFFADRGNFLIGDVESLGWILLVLGVAQLLAGAGVWARNFAAVWVGVLCTAVNLVGHLLFLPARPLWSLAIAALDVLVLHALITHVSPD